MDLLFFVVTQNGASYTTIGAGVQPRKGARRLTAAFLRPDVSARSVAWRFVPRGPSEERQLTGVGGTGRIGEVSIGSVLKTIPRNVAEKG